MVRLILDDIAYLMKYGRPQMLPHHHQNRYTLSLRNPELRFLTSFLVVQEKPLVRSYAWGPLPKVEVLLKFVDINIILTTPHE